MYGKFQFEEVTYREAAPGWVDGVYYPRKEQVKPCSAPQAVGGGNTGDIRQEDGTEQPDSIQQTDGVWKLHSRVWQEIEETGYGVYYYEETTQIVTELSGKNYLVTVRLVNPEDKPYSCHIRVNGILKVSGVEVAPGEKREVTFTACMTDGQFALTLSTGILEEIHGEVLEGDVYIGDIDIVPEQEKERREKPRLFLVSDSTVQSYEKYFYPQTGWGQMLCHFFRGYETYREYPSEHCDYPQGRTYELPGLVIENRSIGGRSARSFYDEGKLDQVLEVICPGDYMFVQFAHNDATAIRPNRYIAPEEFSFFLQRYVDACRRRNVQLVFVTPVTMRVLDEDGRNIICFAEYREQMMKLAEEQNIPLLDLSGRSTDYLNQIGSEESKHLYLWLEEGEYPDGAYAGGVSDKCHLQEYGAKVYADMVAQMIKEYGRDDRLDALKRLAAPVAVEEIPKPSGSRSEGGNIQAESVKYGTVQGETGKRGTAQTESGKSGAARGKTVAPDAVTGFVVQEVSLENGRGSFLLNWNSVEGAAAYHIYGKKEKELTFRVVKSVTREEKEALAVLPFTAESGAIWQYYVTAVFANGREGGASRVQEVDLR